MRYKDELAKEYAESKCNLVHNKALSVSHPTARAMSEYWRGRMEGIKFLETHSDKEWVSEVNDCYTKMQQFDIETDGEFDKYEYCLGKISGIRILLDIQSGL